MYKKTARRRLTKTTLMINFRYKNNNMKRIILIFLGLFSLAYGQFSPSGSKIRYVNGISIGTKLDAYFNSADSNAIYWRADSVLRAKYRGMARTLAFIDNLADSLVWGNITGSLNNQTDLRDTLAQRVNLTTNQTIGGTKTFSSTISGSINGNAQSATQLNVNSFSSGSAPVAVTSTGAPGIQNIVYNGSFVYNATAATLFTPNALLSGSLEAGSIIKTGGTSSQFLKADGSVDGNTYATTSSLSSYVPYTGATTNVNLGSNTLTAGGATLTGALSGTTGLFSGSFEAGRTGGAVTAGDLTVDPTSTAARVLIGRLSSTSNDNTTLIIRNRVGTQTGTWNSADGSLTLSGALSGTSGTFSSFVQGDYFQTGATPATSGGLRLGTQVAIRARNVANTANVELIASTATDAVSIGGTTANVGIGTTSPTARLDVSDGNIGLIVGADDGSTSRTNNATKVSRFGFPHYSTTEEPAAYLVGVSDASDNAVSIGGNTGLFNAATRISFFTAANNTTVGGTERGRITSAGRWLFGTTTDDGSSIGQFAGNLLVTVSGTANIRLKGSSVIGFDLQNDVAGAYLWNRDATDMYFATNSTLRLTINGSTGAATFSSSVTANSFIKSGGTSSEYLMADGSVTTLAGGLSSGTYSPNPVAINNITSATASSAQYLRVGNVVTVSGQVTITPAANSTSTSIRMPLPIASNFTSANHAAGVATAENTSIATASMYADFTNDQVGLVFTSINTSSNVFYYTYTYRIL